jgi:hypothetical protein
LDKSENILRYSFKFFGPKLLLFHQYKVDKYKEWGGGGGGWSLSLPGGGGGVMG